MELDASAAPSKIEEAVDYVESGGRCVITRDGEPVAIMVPYAKFEELLADLSRLEEII